MRKRIYLISIMWVRRVLLSWFINEVGVVWIFGEGTLCLWRMTQVGKKLSSPILTNLILKLWSLHIVVYVESLYRRLRWHKSMCSLHQKRAQKREILFCLQEVYRLLGRQTDLHEGVMSV